MPTWKHFQENKLSEIVDKSIEVENMDETLRVIQIGLLCTQESPSLRPTMTTVIQLRMQKELALPIPSKSPFTDDAFLSLSCFPGSSQ
ncbi:unnamed protein product [Ilex paraguariensis]|uniref:Uncharacterized protein n=1 Tax=Ilex paraguariensis TaxID=185542 RepID=A0ABC8SX63_9AQUA